MKDTVVSSTVTNETGLTTHGIRAAHDKKPGDGTLALRATPWTTLLDCPIARLQLEDVSTLAEAFIASQRPHYIAVVNVAKLMKMRHDKALRQSILTADIVGADGVPVVWASRLLGSPLPGRVNGTDLMLKLLEKSDQKGYRIFFFGAQAEVLDRVLHVVRTTYPGVQIAGAQHGYFTEEEESDIVRRIQTSQADILFIAFGTPKKELWVQKYLQEMGVSVVHGVGGSFDVLAGALPRAPLWMQRSGLEWLFRLWQEPRRLWQRYLVTNTQFIVLLFWAWSRHLLRAMRQTQVEP
jgi:N-acetylglucosaminyldiphosphoundecaprenol N-acetyl-beta-D-mannosaminyltransferase